MYKNSARHKNKHHDYDLYADLEKIKDAFGDTARDMKGKATSMISESLGNAREKTTLVQDNVVNYIQTKPIKAVGLAVLAGVIVGIWMHRK